MLPLLLFITLAIAKKQNQKMPSQNQINFLVSTWMIGSILKILFGLFLDLLFCKYIFYLLLKSKSLLREFDFQVKNSFHFRSYLIPQKKAIQAMNKRTLLISLLLISSFFLLFGAQKQSPFDVSGNTSVTVDDSKIRFYGTQDLPEAREGISVKSAKKPVAAGRARVHSYKAKAVLQLRNNEEPFENEYFFSIVEESTEEPLCSKSKACYLAVGHGYQKPYQETDQKIDVKYQPTVAAYLRFNEANNYNIIYEATAGDTWRPILAKIAEKLNPLNKQSKQNQVQIKLPDFKATKSILSQSAIPDNQFPHLIASEVENYDFDLVSESDVDDIDAGTPEGQKLNPKEIFRRNEEQVKLAGRATFSFDKVQSRDIIKENLAVYRKRIGKARVQTRDTIRKSIQTAAVLIQTDSGIDPDFTQIDRIKDQKLGQPISFDKYFKGQAKFEQDYSKFFTQQTTKKLAIQQPERLLEQSNRQAQRLLPVIATHTIYEQTKILYSKTALGKLIEVKFYGKCQLIISNLPDKHEIYCFGQLQYKVFGVSKIKTLFAFTKQIGVNWSWGQNWGGNWIFSFSVPLPPPVSFITINFYVTVGYKINLNLQSSVVQWWYPLIHEVKAVASTSLWVDAAATVKVLAVEGGVFIAGTIVKVSTDPTCTLYYYLKQQHKLIIFWIKWYWETLAFQFKWGFKCRYWFFGWKPWKIIAKWTVSNGIIQKQKILNKSFVLHY